MPDNTRLKGVSHVGDVLLSEQLEANLVSWFNWGFLGIGGFFNVTIPTSGAYGGNQHQLRPASDTNLEDGQVWQAFRRDWVWETGVEYAYQPIRVSGVYVDGIFYSTSTTGVYAHHVDYPNGRVVFDEAIDTESTVTCEYSYRYVHFTSADVPWWRQIQTESFRVDDSHFSQLGSGVWSLLSQNRVQLPAVVVETVPRTTRRPKELGGGGAIVRQDVLFHVISETPHERNHLHDIVTYQWGKRIILFDKNLFNDADAFPLDGNGTPVSGASMYPTWVAATGDGGYGWRQLRFEDFSSLPQPQQITMPVYVASVRGVFEVDLP